MEIKRYYDHETIHDLATYQPVKIIDFDDNEYECWLIPFGKKYKLLPIDINNSIVVLNRSEIKSIYTLKENELIPKRRRVIK